MNAMNERFVRSGLPHLDEVLQGYRLGDNVVFQVDKLEDYMYFVGPFVRQAVADGRKCIYVRFAPHAPLVAATTGVLEIELHPGAGFDPFCSEVHEIIAEQGTGAFYVFDNLSALVADWATDELLASFFQVTCPYLFEMDTVTYFALLRGKHIHGTVAKIRDTTQVLVDVYHVGGDMYLQPLKVWDRYSPQMFLPHQMSSEGWVPVFRSGQAAAVSSRAGRKPLRMSNNSIAPWESVYRQLIQLCEGGKEIDASDPEVGALRHELCRMLIGHNRDFLKLADQHFTAADLIAMRELVIGSGRVGGKAVGMMLARSILRKSTGEVDFSEILEDHDSFFIGSDVFFSFLVDNHLFRLRLRLSRSTRITHEEFEDVRRRFLEGTFSRDIVAQFREVLDYYGQAPIIVRSSSLLEDSFGNAFAGKYQSEFCVNQGGPEERLEQFMHAVKLVYASALNPDALSYRRQRGLAENDEQMAILVQRVSGSAYEHYFFPTAAGVAFSRNLYAWSNRIDPKRGMIRIVFGLGTRAVDRVGDDYPRMVSVSHPELRPELGERIAQYSQRVADVLDLEANRFASAPISKLLAARDYRQLHLLVSLMSDGQITDPATRVITREDGELVLTFNNLIRRTAFVEHVGAMLAQLEAVYEHPVEIEFTAAVDAEEHVRINLLQCRPMWLPGGETAVRVPADIARARILFRAQHLISGGVVEGIRHIIYIDPQAYAGIGDLTVKRSIGRVVGRVNEHPRLAGQKVLMMGPGRWGSSNIELGVNVGYAEINNAAVLVELAREEAGHVPEVSYGTHFFQDLVEAQIIYLPVYPDDPAADFNGAFFADAANVLAALLPEDAKFADYVRVIDVAACRGTTAKIIADAEGQRAICYLEEPDTGQRPARRP